MSSTSPTSNIRKPVKKSIANKKRQSKTSYAQQLKQIKGGGNP